ncbi:transposase, partial [Allochromatium vinosum]|uniref:transposase n=1 Tax=Allochromatium vinosum TaxID=1049 RepID=UPI0030B851E0
AHAADPAIPLTVTTLYNQVSVAWAGLSKTPLQRSSQWGIERFFNRLKQFRRVATRYDKLANRYSAFLHLACAYIWLL